jgi:hypothetical protein
VNSTDAVKINKQEFGKIILESIRIQTHHPTHAPPLSHRPRPRQSRPLPPPLPRLRLPLMLYMVSLKDTLISLFTMQFVMFHKRFRDEEGSSDEDCAAVAMLCIRKRRLNAQLSLAFLEASAHMINAYVDYRGGINALLNFELSEPTFDFDSCCDKRFAQWFRFSKANVTQIIHILVNVVGFPEEVVSYAGDSAPLRTAFLCMCMKYAWPTRLGTMTAMFGKGSSWISRIIKALRELLFNKFHSRLRNPSVLSVEDLQRFSCAVSKKSGVDVVFGFLDGTIRPVCKPGDAQNEVYNGKDCVHALKYQIVSTPDGIIRHLDGPWPGRRHDQHMVTSAPWSAGTPVLQNWLLAHPKTPYESQYVIYADAGYATAPGIETPWPDGHFNLEHAAYNAAMCSSRIAVEWEFGHILFYWAAHHFKPQQKLLSEQGIGQIYFVCALLMNMYTCLHGSKTSTHFGLQPPSLLSYIQSMLR